MDLTNFLRTGVYLKLKVGLVEEEIYSVFKKEDLIEKCYFDRLNKEKVFSYFYNALEIRVIDSKINSLNFYLARYPVTLLNENIIYSETNFELIIKYLDIANIKWYFDKQIYYSRELAIKTEGNVLISCVYDKGNYWLSKFQTFE